MKYKYIITSILLLIFCSFTVVGQTDVEIKKKEFKLSGDKKAFKTAWEEVQIGDGLFLQGKGAFFMATDHYKKAFEYNSSNPELNYKLGVSMLMSDEKTTALEYLEMAQQAKADVAPDILYFIGYAHHLQHSFDKAIEYYNAYRATLSKKQLKEEGYYLEVLVSQCNNGKRLVNEPVRVVIKNMGSNINSEYEDYAPAVTANDSLFIFTSRRQHGKKSKYNEKDNKFYESIYYSIKSGDDWGSSKLLFGNDKVKENMAVTGMSSDGKTIYVYKGASENGDIFYTTKKKGKWQNPKPIPGKINSSEKDGSVAISPDGNTMYFTSKRKKDGLGGLDIYISRKKENGKWDKPINATKVFPFPEVNTPLDETGVAIHPNGKTLYFSSQGHNSMGGYDIFECDIDANGGLSGPENIGYPINTAGDDLFYVPSFSGKIAYISSIRENTLGANDIYKVILLSEEKPFEPGYNEMDVAGAPGVNADIFFEEPQKMDLTPVFEISGIITSAEDFQPIDGNVKIIDAATNQQIDETQANLSGNYKLGMPGEGNYIIKVLASGFMPYSGEVVFTQPDKKKLDVSLTKIEVGETMVLKNIYFNSGTARLKKDSYEELDHVYMFLMGNPSLKLELAGYTDNIGSVEVNMVLSKKRAKACVDYLVQKGIAKEKLKYEGYGLLNPISHNHTPEGRSKNRRVEFKVLEK